MNNSPTRPISELEAPTLMVSGRKMQLRRLPITPAPRYTGAVGKGENKESEQDRERDKASESEDIADERIPRKRKLRKCSSSDAPILSIPYCLSRSKPSFSCVSMLSKIWNRPACRNMGLKKRHLKM